LGRGFTSCAKGGYLQDASVLIDHGLKTRISHCPTEVFSFSLLTAMTPCVDWKVLEIEGCSVAPNVACICDVWMEEGVASVFGFSRDAPRDYQMWSNTSR